MDAFEILAQGLQLLAPLCSLCYALDALIIPGLFGCFDLFILLRSFCLRCFYFFVSVSLYLFCYVTDTGLELCVSQALWTSVLPPKYWDYLSGQHAQPFVLKDHIGFYCSFKPPLQCLLGLILHLWYWHSIMPLTSTWVLQILWPLLPAEFRYVFSQPLWNDPRYCYLAELRGQLFCALTNPVNA